MLSLKAGITSSPGLPQTDFRVGGRRSVRGFDYGYQRGQAMWALQADWAPIGSWIRPVLFADAGQAAAADQLSQTEILVGGGAGVSLVRGLIRIDFSHAINPGVGGLRVDVAVLAPR
jgi:hemolysin activation/secretion protein